jgi:hypothetical protein
MKQRSNRTSELVLTDRVDACGHDRAVRLAAEMAALTPKRAGQLFWERRFEERFRGCFASFDAGWSFNFSETQWEAILGAVSDGCSEPSRFRMDALLNDVNGYLKNMPRHRPASKRAATWRQYARSVAEFRKIAIDTYPGILWQESLGKSKYAKFLDALEFCERIADSQAQAIQDRVPDNPRMVFFEAVVDRWVASGGRLGCSRDPNTQAPAGPLVRYFRAVTVPVMGADAPTLEGIYKMIGRAKKSYVTRGYVFDEDGLFDEKVKSAIRSHLPYY